MTQPPFFYVPARSDAGISLSFLGPRECEVVLGEDTSQALFGETGIVVGEFDTDEIAALLQGGNAGGS